MWGRHLACQTFGRQDACPTTSQTGELPMPRSTFCGSAAHAMDRRAFLGGAAAALTMMRGRRDEAALRYPDLGAVVAREFGLADSKVPDYVTFYTQTEGRSMAPGAPGFLGARYAPMELTTNNYPEHIKRLDALSDVDHKERAELRDLI